MCAAAERGGVVQLDGTGEVLLRVEVDGVVWLIQGHECDVCEVANAGGAVLAKAC